MEEFIKEEATNKRTDYVSNFVYQNDSVQYAGTGMGRTVWQNDTAKEDFFVKDHLGNVRSVVDVYHYPLLAYLATYEVASAQLENLFFDDVDGIRDDKPGSTDPADTKAGRLNGSEPDHRVGTSLLLKVMAGDKVQLNVNSYYDGYDATQDQPVDGEQILESIVSTLTGGEGGLGESESHDPELVDKLFTPENYANAADLLDANTDPSKPKAFLNYILFNEDMQVVGSFTGAFQATGDGAWTEIGMQEPLPIPENGYLAVYLSNATAIECDDCGGDGGIHPGDVFFDQVAVRFTRGNLKEETHYYPFGLPMGDIGSAAVGFTPNRRKYQGNEYIKDAGLNWMDFNARQYDPQTGRFLSIDPMGASGNQDMFSPYAAMGDEPAGLVDPGGMRVGPPVVSKTLLFLPDLSFMSPTMRAMAGGGVLIWLPYGDPGAAFGQANMDYYGQKILANQNEAMGNNGNNSGDGSVVNNGGSSGGSSNDDGGCTSMTTDYHGGNGNSGGSGTGGLPWYDDWNGDAIHAINLPSGEPTMSGTPVDQTAFGQGMNELFMDISPFGLINIPLKYATGTSLLGNKVSGMSPFEAIVPIVGSIEGTTVLGLLMRQRRLQ